MEIEETFHLIGVAVAFPILVEEADRPIERVDHDPGRLASLGWLERWIETANEIVRVIHAIGAEHEIETRCADQIESRNIVTCPEHTANGHVVALLLTESVHQGFWRAGAS
jgi:hypothetical protein